jgi:hypothetical protein
MHEYRIDMMPSASSPFMTRYINPQCHSAQMSLTRANTLASIPPRFMLNSSRCHHLARHSALFLIRGIRVKLFLLTSACESARKQAHKYDICAHGKSLALSRVVKELER